MPFPIYSINLDGRLCSLEQPMVMGILNVTPDSFYEASRTYTSNIASLRNRVHDIIKEGADIIDIGAYSTRPGANEITQEEEIRRLGVALEVIRKDFPNVLISVDTWRAEVARWCVDNYGVQLINDISGGEMDKTMLRTVAKLKVPYILMHIQGTPQTMQVCPTYENVTAEVLEFLARRVQRLRDYGTGDIIIDVGFGFGKTLEQNYQLMSNLDFFHELNCPILVGVSRKSMIYNLLGGTPYEALNGTTVLHSIALSKGANFLRVHDVKAAVETCQIVQKIKESGFAQKKA